ncbi:VOC family protein [Rhodococcus koreensis]
MTSDPASPRLSGIHHITFPVGDLPASLTWYQQVMHASHVTRLDHLDEAGERYSAVVRLPNSHVLVELRQGSAPDNYPSETPFLAFEVEDHATLIRWAEHLDAQHVDRTEIARRRVGFAFDFSTLDGMRLSLYTAPDGGFDNVPFADPHSHEILKC